MKKVIYLCWLAVAVALASCSSQSPTEKILEGIPADADLVGVINLQTVIESAGGSVAGSDIQLPKDLQDLLPENDVTELKKSIDKMKSLGLDMEAIGMMIPSYSNGVSIMVMTVNNMESLEAYLDKEGYTAENADQFKLYSKKTYESEYDPDWNSHAYVAVKGNYSYHIENVWGSDYNARNAFEEIFEGVDRKPMSKSPFGKQIAKGNVGGMALILPAKLRDELRDSGIPSSLVDLYDGVFCMSGELDGDKASVKMNLLNDDGSAKDLTKIDDFCDLKARIDGDALKYMSDDESIVLAAALKDYNWDTMLDVVAATQRMSRSKRAAMSMVSAYLRQIDGTIALGFGLKDGLKSYFNLIAGKDPFNMFSATLVVQTADGKADQIISDLKKLMDGFGMPYDNTGNGFSISIPYQPGEFYVEAKGNFVIFANHPIEKGSNPVVKEVDFTDYISAAGLVINKSNPLFKDLGIDNDVKVEITSDAKKCEAKIEAEVTGGPGKGFVSKLAHMIFTIANNQNTYEKRFNPNYREPVYDDCYYDDDEVIECYDGEFDSPELAD